jgi:hypothetical protein
VGVEEEFVDVLAFEVGTVITNCETEVALSPTLSVTVKLVETVPDSVGIPWINPSLSSIKPLGKILPAVTVAVSCPVPPPNVSCAVKAVPIVPLIVGGALIVGGWCNNV